ncbi:glycosyltransferase family 4 protein [Dietzia sp. CW19]|uniref:Glycosyltransferase family 4 protein n=1 Tax=Dietzia maris TaxID=37915 RepID=A0AAE4QWT7_9ACTN|nr:MULTISPECIES: glycosyltransferase family 4 protein [Dietzia]MBB1052557.1 glycosyltransferase family 4 protein [Dietzia sp. CW19]MDV6298593.1 glycosyltransferase family 4 protein [Dietzia maris]
MKIGILSHWFDPEGGAAAGPGTIARALQARGHEVDVLTGYPIYPAGRVFDGYRIRPYMRETIRGVNVHRVPAYPSHDDNAARRMANYLSYGASSTLSAPAILGKSDVVFVYSSPATAATAAGPLRALKGIPYVMQIQDLWPDTVTSSGFVDDSTGSRMERALHVFCNETYRRAAHVAVISPGMADVLQSRGVPAEKISVVPNWAEESSFRPVPRNEELSAQLGIDREFTIMYAGNLGEMQNLDAFLDAASILRNRSDIGFVLVGAGVRGDALAERVTKERLDNVTFVGPQPFDKMADILALADVQLISLKDVPLYRITMPSKVQANMAAGLPIIAAVAGDAARVVEDADCGRSVAPGDANALASTISELADMNPAAREELGRKSRDYYTSHFSEKAVGDSLEKLLYQHRKRR